MKILHSFRGRLALRFGATLMLVATVASAIGYAALRSILFSQLDSSLHRLAEIEAAGTADSRDETVHFHEELFGEAAEHEARPTRYAQVWSVDGESVLRTRNLQGRDLHLPTGILERVATSEVPEFFEFAWGERRFRGLVYPLRLLGPQHRAHLLEVAAPTDQVLTVLGRFLRMLVLLVLGGAVVASAFGWWLAGHAVRPVMQIIKQAEALNMNRGAHRIAAEAHTEELNRLVCVLNAMLARIDEAFENQRRFLADAGHEIKTPLTVLRGDLEVALRRRRTPEEYEAVLGQTLEDLREASSLAEDLITLARSDSGGLEPRLEEVTVAQLLTRVADRYKVTAEGAGIRLDLAVADGIVVAGDSALLERAVGNLVDNAVKYSGVGRFVSLSAARRSEGNVEIVVRDNGPGIPAEECTNLFERFYRGDTGRRSTRGIGLGLAIVKAIVEAHRGWVDIQSMVGRGTTVSLVLPAPISRDRPLEESEKVGATRHFKES